MNTPVGDVIERLEKLKVYYIEAEVDEFGEDGELVITEMEQSDHGEWISKHELYGLIKELKNALQ